jgi:hypothetical protein
VLAISFSTPDMVGHAFGPRSQEIQDLYTHLDATIGTLFDALDAQVGKGQWVAALSADHGVTTIPDQLVAEGKDGGRIAGGTLIDAVNQALLPTLGQGRHAIALSTNDLYFAPGVYDKVRRTPAAISAAVAALAARPGICGCSERGGARPRPMRRIAAARRGAQLLPRTQRRSDHCDQAGMDDLRGRHHARLGDPPTISACRCCFSGEASSRAE